MRIPIARRALVIVCAALFFGGCSRAPSDAPQTTTTTRSAAASTTAKTSTTVRPKTSTTTRPLASGLEGILVDAYTLREGDCFNHYTHYQDFQPIEIFTQRSCAATHDGEVYFRTDYQSPLGGLYPGREALARVATKLCYNAFESYVKTPYETSKLKLSYLLPPQDRWDNPALKYRTITCYVLPASSGVKLTESVRNLAI